MRADMELAYDLQRIAEELRFAGDSLEAIKPDDVVERHRLQMARDHIQHAARIAGRLQNEAARLATESEAAA